MPITSPFAELYQLLSFAHYRTSPTDLRRLLDGADQHFMTAEMAERIAGVVWGLEEGNFADKELIEQIRLVIADQKGI